MKIHIKENTGKWKHNKGSNLFDGTSLSTRQMQLGSAYWKQQARKPIFTTELVKFNKRKAEEGRQKINEFKKWAATKGKRLVEKSQKDYLTTSNDNTWVENRNPMVKASRLKNPHLTERSVKGAKAHAAWEKEHPVLNTWGNVLGAVPFAVASAPLAAAAGSGIAALGDAAAATSAGQAAIEGLTPLTTAASTSVAGAPLYTWADAGLSSLFGAHGIQTAIDEGGISPTTALEIAPLGRLTRPMWNAGKEGVQYAAKVADNTTRYVSPSYDLYRSIGETTPRTTPRLHSFYTSDLTGSTLNERVYTGSPIFEFGQTIRTSPEKAYFMRAPKDIDILKLENGRFRHEVVGNEVLPSGEVNGKFVSYGEPWKEFALGENSALYEFPVGPRRGPSLMATDWKGRPQKYSVDEIYDYMQKEKALNEGFRKDVTELGLDKLKGAERVEAYRALKEEKYPELLEDYDTSIHGANQTVIPNDRWNFDKFLKTPFWKYSENPISGQVQKELMMKLSEAKSLETPTIEWTDAVKPPQITLTEHVQGDEAVKMFKEYGGEPIPEGSINGELLRKYVTEVRERYGLTNNKNITDEEIAQALYKHSKELGGNTAAVNALGEPLLLFRGDTKAYTELRNNHHESGGSEDNILGTLFLDRTGIGEGWGPDRYLYLSNKNGEVMAPYRSGIETASFSLLKPKFKDDYLYDGGDKGYIVDEQISYPYWSYTRRSGETIQGNKIASDNFADGTVNHLNAFVVRTPSVRDITNEVVVTGGKPGTPPPFNWLIPKESRIGYNLHDVRLALNKAVIKEAKKHNQGLLKSDRGSYWRGEEHENYDYFALPDFNVQGAKHLLPYDLRIPRNWKDKNIYRGLIPLAGGYTLYNLFNQPKRHLQYLKQGGKIL